MNEKKFNELYKELYNIEVPIQEIKMGYNDLIYLSWNWAFYMMSIRFEDFEVIPTTWEGKNYCYEEGVGAYVETTIKAGGFSRKWTLPVMDAKNNAILKPNMREINDTIMRCAVKTIAMFGLGMKLYIKEEAEKIKKELNKTNTYSGFTGNELNAIVDTKPVDITLIEEALQRNPSKKNNTAQSIYDKFSKDNWLTKQNSPITIKNIEYYLKQGWL